MKKILLGLGFLVVALVIGLAMQPSVGIVRASDPNVCPEGNGWVKDNWQEWEWTNEYNPSGSQKIDKVCVKGGQRLEYYENDANDDCWVINFKDGKEKVSVTEWSCDGAGKGEPSISHVSYHLKDYVPPVIDVCTNLPEVQTTLPDGYYFSSEGICSLKVFGCLDEVANNYNQEATHSDDSCTYDENPYCLEGETILVPDNEDVPEGAEEGACVIDDSEEPEQPKEEPKQETKTESFSAPSPASAPQCADTAPVKEPANPHIYRNGDVAIVKWFPTEGNNAQSEI